MSITLVGIIIIALAGASMLHSLRLVLSVCCGACVFAAAAAMFIGETSIPLAHVGLAFLILAVIIREGGLAAALKSLSYREAGFFLLMFTIWGVTSGFIMPRLFAGEIEVIPLNPQGKTFFAVPLGPRTSNINQSIYAVGNLMTFITVAALMRTASMVRMGCAVLITTAIVHIVMAAVDMVTFAAGVPQLLEFVRNSGFEQRFGDTVMGLKRLTGTYPEASAFSTASTMLFAVMFRLWRGGIQTFWTGWLSIAMVAGVVMAFSSTGFVALGVYLMITYSISLAGTDASLGRDQSTLARRGIVISLGPATGLLIAIAVAIRPELLDPVVELFDSSIVNKLSSDSGVERSSWNMRTLGNFFETAGLGAGLGSVRGSSFIVSLIGSMGFIGTLMFCMFYAKLFAPMPPEARGGPDHTTRQIVAAARSGCFAQLLAACISGTTTDLGLLFYVLAAIASAGGLVRVARHPLPHPAQFVDAPVEA